MIDFVDFPKWDGFRSKLRHELYIAMISPGVFFSNWMFSPKHTGILDDSNGANGSNGSKSPNSPAHY